MALATHSLSEELLASRSAILGALRGEELGRVRESKQSPNEDRPLLLNGADLSLSYMDMRHSSVQVSSKVETWTHVGESRGRGALKTHATHQLCCQKKMCILVCSLMEHLLSFVPKLYHIHQYISLIKLKLVTGLCMHDLQPFPLRILQGITVEFRWMNVHSKVNL